MKTLFALLFFLGSLVATKAQRVSLVRDLETDGAYPADLIVAGSQMFFVSSTPATGEELWATDGVAAPHRVKNPSPAQPTSFRAMDGLLYFDSQDNGFWRSDGTEAGTYRITKVASDPVRHVALGKIGPHIIFSTFDKVWATEGTAGSATLLTNAYVAPYLPGVQGSDGRFYFAATTPTGGGLNSSLWSTDGTASGTRNIAFVSSVGIREIATAGRYIFLSAGLGLESSIWRSDGTGPGTQQFQNLAGGTGKFPRFAQGEGKLFFTDSSRDLFVTDGEVTERLADLPAAGPSAQVLKVIEGLAYFAYYDEQKAFHLWRSNGTSAGTAELPIQSPAPFSRVAYYPDDKSAEDVVSLNGYLYYFAETIEAGWTLWRMKSATGESERVADLPDNLTRAQPKQLTLFDGAIYFSAHDGVEGRKLWRSDGTDAGTRVAADDFSGSYTSFGDYIRPGENGRAYFITSSQDLFESTLWQTDGTHAGTSPLVSGLVSPGDPYYVEAQYTEIFEHAEIVYFTGNDGIHGHELWRTDGTDAGTFLIKDFYPGNGFYDPHPQGFILFQGSVLFAATDLEHGCQLWKTDGTSAGTTRVSNIGGGNCSFIADLKVIGQTLFFQAGTRDQGAELWKSDGSMEGTVLVKDVQAGQGSSSARVLGKIGDRILLAASLPGVPDCLWSTDGTEEGTVRIKAPQAEQAPFGIGDAAIYKGKLFFRARESEYNSELWVSDGTEAGTHLFKDLWPGYQSSWPYGFTVMDGALYFAADGSENTTALWKTYGTPEGTSIVANVSPQGMRAMGGLLYFRSGSMPQDLWRSDGTAAGTFRLPINPRGAALPRSLTVVGNQLLFFAYDGFTGHELWSATPDPNSAPSRLANISTRGFIGQGDQILIGGFIINGTSSQTVVVRGIGPSLRNWLPNYLRNPQLKLFDSSGNQIGFNDDWKFQDAAQLSATGLAPSEDAEAAILATLSPGAYTLHLSGADGGSGIGLVEVYALPQAGDAHLANISTRGQVGGGDNILIGGFISQGETPPRLIVRAIGASLASGGMPLPNRLADPVLEIYDANGVQLARNDNWRNEQMSEIEASGLAPESDLDSALLIGLPNGAYTALVKGANNTGGLALIEVYQLP